MAHMSTLATPRLARMSSSSSSSNDSSSPQRRSAADLQVLIDELFAERTQQHSPTSSVNDDGGGYGAKTARAADLPAILAAFEQRKSIVLLSDEEKLSLQAFAEQHADLEVTSESLLSVLVAMQHAANSDRHSNDDGHEHDGLIVPDSPTPANDQLPTPPASLKHKSSSNSLSSQSSSESRSSNMLTARGTLLSPEPDFGSYTRSSSMPEGISMGGQSSPPFTPTGSIAHQRRHTGGPAEEKPLPDRPGARPLHHTPIASLFARQRSSTIDIHSNEAFKRSRPAPPKSRRISGSDIVSRSRQSSEEPSPKPLSPPNATSPVYQSLDSMYEEDDQHAQYAGYPHNRSRQNSGRSDPRESSPVFGLSTPEQREMPLFSPSSPAIEPKSYYPTPRSPNESMRSDFSVMGDSSDAMHTRPVSTISLGSEAAMSELIQSLQQELARKTQDLEAQRADGYSAVMEKEALLEETRAELAAKRREEKELRSKEKLNLNQIATLEVQTATFRDERDKQRIAYQSARRQYEEQCNESEKLRNTIRSKDEELRVADETVQNGASDLAKVTRERDHLQSSFARLEGEVQQLKATIDALEEEKQESLTLRETIDRLRLELDELRAQARLHESGTGGAQLRRSGSGTESMPSSLSRNLGRELARRMQDGGDDESTTRATIKEESVDAFEEEIITTRRRLKRPVKQAAVVASTSTSTDQLRSDSPTIEVVDIGLQIDLRPDQKNQETQSDPEVEMSPSSRRQALARELAVDLDAVEEYIREKEERGRPQAALPDTAPPPYQREPSAWHKRLQPYTPFNIPNDTNAFVTLVLQSSSNLLLYSLLIYVSGVLTGSFAFPAKHFYHNAPYDSTNAWAAYNTFDGPPGVHSGVRQTIVFWLEKAVWRSVAMSRRVPT